MNRENEIGNVLPFLQPQKKPEGPAQQTAMEVVMALRQFHPEADRTVGRGMVAFDRRDPSMQLDLCTKETIDYCNQNFQHMMYHPELYGMGAVMLRSLNLSKSKHWAAEMLGLERADDAMTDALLAALLGTLGSATSPVHLETALFAVASFVHAHPRFEKIRRPCSYEPPFGEHTEYTVCDPVGSG